MNTTRFHVLRGRIAALEEMLQSWPGDLPAAWLGHELADAVAECTGWPAEIKAAWNTLLRYFEEWPAELVIELRRSLDELFSAASRATERLRSQFPTAAGTAAADLDPIRAAAGDLQRLREFIFEYWPEFTAEAAEEAQAAIERGEGIPIEDLLHELQSKSTSLAGA